MSYNYGECSGAWFKPYRQRGGQLHGAERWGRVDSKVEIGYESKTSRLSTNHKSDFVSGGSLVCIPFTSSFARKLDTMLLPRRIDCRFLPDDPKQLVKESTHSVFTRCMGTFKALYCSYRKQIKIGLTANPIERSQSYMEAGYTRFCLVHSSWEKGLIEMLETALIAQTENLNKCGGGGGCSPGEPGSAGPWWVYMVTKPCA